MKKTKVTLYTREHGTQEYKEAKRNFNYPHGTSFVLRYAARWETLKSCRSYGDGVISAMEREIALLKGEVAKPRPKVKPKQNHPDALDLLVEKRQQQLENGISTPILRELEKLLASFRSIAGDYLA